MVVMNLKVPDRVKTAAEVKAAAAGYGSVDDYVVSLIEADELPPIDGDLEAGLLAGLDSGPSIPLTPEMIEELRGKLRLGLEQLEAGDGAPWDVEEMKSRIRHRFSDGSKSA